MIEYCSWKIYFERISSAYETFRARLKLKFIRRFFQFSPNLDKRMGNVYCRAGEEKPFQWTDLDLSVRFSRYTLEKLPNECRIHIIDVGGERKRGNMNFPV